MPAASSPGSMIAKIRFTLRRVQNTQPSNSRRLSESIAAGSSPASARIAADLRSRAAPIRDSSKVLACCNTRP